MTDRQTLHFLTCGHVDDGKSTLMGRLLYDIGAIPDDQVGGAMVDGKLDFSRLTDGLEDERAQGITIDVAYRYFRYKGRAYRIADTPGHVQYTRNMAVAAANSDCAMILVDAAHGVREQTIRHSRIAAFFGIKHFVIAVNKMDRVDYSELRFKEIELDYRAKLGDLAAALSLTFVPVSALQADNVIVRSAKTSWYKGPVLIDYLANLEVPQPHAFGARLPVQSVIRIGDTRGYQGMLNGGHIKRGERIGIAGSNASVPVTALYHSGKEVEEVQSGQAITLVTNDDVDLSRGNVLHALASPSAYIDSFTANLLWIDPAFEQSESVTGIIKIHNREEQVEVRNVSAAASPVMAVNVFSASPLPLDIYARHRSTGLFLLIESESEKVIGVGTVTALAPVEAAPLSQVSSFF